MSTPHNTDMKIYLVLYNEQVTDRQIDPLIIEELVLDVAI